MELLARRGINIAAVILSLLLHAALLFGADRLIGAFGASTASNPSSGGKITLLALAPAMPEGNVESPKVQDIAPPEGAEPVLNEEPPLIEPVVSEPSSPILDGGSGTAVGEVPGAVVADDVSGVSVGPPAPVVRKAAEPLSDIQPSYPFKSRKLGRQGTVVLELLISEEGIPLSCAVARSSGWPELDEEARRTAMESRFRPAREEGRSVKDLLKLSVVFRLDA